MSDEEKELAAEGQAEEKAPHPKKQSHHLKHVGTKGKKDGGMTTKVIAAVFGAVIAPVLVAAGVKWFDRIIKDPRPAPKEEHASTGKAPTNASVISLVTPNLSEHFYTYAWDPGLQEDVRKDTIDPALFRYEEKPDRIVVPGGPKHALLTTKEEYEDYTLHFWYRWGQKQWGEGEGKARRSSILLHIHGPDGAFNGIWPNCLNVNFGEGETGTFRLTANPNRIKCKARATESPDRLYRIFVGGDAPELPQVTGTPPAWKGLIHRLGFPEGVQRDDTGAVVGFPKGWHPEGDPALPGPPYKEDQWNRVVVECNKGTITVTVNRQLVNAITGLNVTKGRIAFASRWNEYEIQRVELELKRPEPSAEKAPVKVRKKPARKAGQEEPDEAASEKGGENEEP